MTEKIRLNKFISDSGTCSRREADKLIEQGHVFVNGHRAAVGAQVSKHDKVTLNGNLIEAKEGTDFVFSRRWYSENDCYPQESVCWNSFGANCISGRTI